LIAIDHSTPLPEIWRQSCESHLNSEVALGCLAVPSPFHLF
jgi:hypothetical protein